MKPMIPKKGVGFAPIPKICYDSERAATNLSNSLQKWGFAVLTHHPIASQLITAVYQEWELFFQSPHKHRYTFDPQLQSGYFPLEAERAKGSDRADLKEFFHVFCWSTLPEGMSDRTWQLFAQLNALAAELLEWLEATTPTDVRSRWVTPLGEAIADSRETLLRILHYPPLTGEETAGALRAAPHEDINSITLLPAATSTGLEVCDRGGTWYAIATDPGDLVVNIGDMLQMASGGYFRSTPHRVVNPPATLARESRYSLPFFLHPRADVELTPGFTAGQYLQERLQELGLLSKLPAAARD